MSAARIEERGRGGEKIWRKKPEQKIGRWRKRDRRREGDGERGAVDEER